MNRSLTVVTFEKRVGPNSTKVKIPNICEQFNVDYCDLFHMMRQLGARL